MNVKPDQLAIQAAVALNADLLTSDAAWGYNGSVEDFARLLQECHAIVTREVFLPTLDTVLDAYWDIQMEVMNGDRNINWYL
jgi:hypothetical protein